MPSVINQFVEYYDSNQSISSANCRLASTTLLFDHPQLDENQFNPVQENKELQKLVQDFRSTEFTRAAQLLFDLSVNRSSLLTLTKRMELLSKALVCLNSAQNEIGRVRGEICEKMDLAVIQQKMRLRLQFIETRIYDSNTLNRCLKKLDNQLMTKDELLKIANDYNLTDLQNDLNQTETEDEDEDKENNCRL